MLFYALRLLSLALACSFIAINRLVTYILSIVIEATELYDTETAMRWGFSVSYVIKFILAILFNPFLRMTGDSLIKIGEPPVEISNWEYIPVGFFLWAMFKLLSGYIADWARASEEATGKLYEVSIVLAEGHCQPFWRWTQNGVYTALIKTEIFAPIFRFLPIQLTAIFVISALSALCQLKILAFIFLLLATGFLMLIVSCFVGMSFPVVTYINMVHASRHDLLRHANKIKTENEFNEFIRDPYQYQLKEKN